MRAVQTEIRAIDPRPDAGSARVGEQLGERGIRSAAGKKIVRVEAGQVVFEDGAEPVGLLIGVPPHRPPVVLREAGLTDDSGWAPLASRACSRLAT